MTENYYHYTKDLTTGAIEAAIKAHRQRGHKPESIMVRPDSGIEAGKIDGLPVVVEEVKPKNHYVVVI